MTDSVDWTVNYFNLVLVLVRYSREQIMIALPRNNVTEIAENNENNDKHDINTTPGLTKVELYTVNIMPRAHPGVFPKCDPL